ncbi:hypothetical protein [Weissella viridescens]|uniref:hypothetical protein n=1 Tax=Weissella viridescens TaxID=1629 RepID=UPI003AF28B17
MPKSIRWLILILLLVVLILFYSPVNFGIVIQLNGIKIEQFFPFSATMLAFLLTILTFGKKIYNVDDLSKILNTNPRIYFSNVADYLFAALLWAFVGIVAILKNFVTFNFSKSILDFLMILYLFTFLVAFVQIIVLVIRNVQRVIIKSLSDASK